MENILAKLPAPVRSILAIILAMFALTILVESFEFTLVTSIEPQAGPGNQAAYFEARNQTWFLILKFFYNFAFAGLAGWLAAFIAGYRETLHGLIFGLIQSGFFIYAMNIPELNSTAPLWAWIGFTFFTGSGIVLGAVLRTRQTST